MFTGKSSPSSISDAIMILSREFRVNETTEPKPAMRFCKAHEIIFDVSISLILVIGLNIMVLFYK